MRKDIFLPALAVAGGVAGLILRRWQLASAYRPETGLFTPGAPATYALLGLTALLAALFLILLRKKREGLDDFLPAFGSPSVGQMGVLAAGGLLMCSAAATGMADGFRALRQWQDNPGMYQISGPGSQLLTGALCVLAGAGVLYMGQMAYRGKINDRVCILVPFPALAALVWLFATHLKHGTEPVLMKYAPTLFAVLLFTLAHYYVAGFFFGKPRPRRAAFCALMGASIGIASLADGYGQRDVFTIAATIAFSLSCLGFAHGLLGSTFGPPRPKRLMEKRMPPPEEEDTENA
ncbi:MAG: LPXTG cell wall anchor domain-containing protein [Lawsonibacter sp.]|nr:LPXTG cell wall anchor domain-containing protein [Lawsonibacter sp.]